MAAKKTTATKSTTQRKKKAATKPVVAEPVQVVDIPEVDVQSPWFKIKLEDVTPGTIIIVGMILAAIVVIANIVL